jgi:carboxylesterase
MAWPRVSKKGFFLSGQKAQVLLIHGYTGSPYDLRILGDFLHKEDFLVEALLLKGHGKKPEHIHDATALDWISQGRKALEKFDKKKPIIVGGLSMGGLIAMVLAAEQKIDALLLFSPSLRLLSLAEITLFAAEAGLLNKNISIKKMSGSDIADPIAKAKTPSLKEMPVSGLLELSKLRTLAKNCMGAISCPIFLAFGKNDQAIDAISSHQMILQGCPNAVIFSKTYEKSKHVITLDYDKEQLFLDVLQFLHQQLGI